MITIEDARSIAEAFLDVNVRERFSFQIVIVEASIRDAGNVWVFPYDGKAYVDRHDWREAMAGNSPVVVDKETGKANFGK
ncbi:YrhB domain-containing protein [Actinoplanes sp. NPDC026670]|uniref:YrhB domain-containing protein n=1 Tax=Actinoplanes sp. NPDC026670 TaxID=3154700 RepID=UPI0033FF2EDA